MYEPAPADSVARGDAVALAIKPERSASKADGMRIVFKVSP